MVRLRNGGPFYTMDVNPPGGSARRCSSSKFHGAILSGPLVHASISCSTIRCAAHHGSDNGAVDRQMNADA